MNLKKNVLLSLTALAALCLFNPHASADAFSASASASFSPISTGGTGTILNLSSFNQSLGTLQSVTLELDLSTNTTPAIFTFGAGNVGTASTGSTISVTGPGSSVPVLSLTYATPFQTLTSTAAGTTNGTTVFGMPSGTGSLLSGFASYETLGAASLTFDVTDIGQTDSGSTISGQTFAGGSGTYNGTLKVIYTFQAVPEPSTWAMLVGGMGLLAFWRSRTARSRA